MKLEITGTYRNTYYFGISEIAYIWCHGDQIQIRFKNVSESLNINYSKVNRETQEQLTKIINRLERRR